MRQPCSRDKLGFYFDAKESTIVEFCNAEKQPATMTLTYAGKVWIPLNVASNETSYHGLSNVEDKEDQRRLVSENVSEFVSAISQ